MTLYIYSNKNVSPAFDPVTQIDPTTVTVNGVLYANATIAKDPVDENNDGIEDAIITITPRSNIGLTAATTSLTVSGKTLATGVNANMVWTATHAITVTGGSSSGGTTTGSLAGSVPIGALRATEYIAPFGPARAVPSLAALSKDQSYKPIPYRVAVQQYEPPPGFAERLIQYYYPKKYVRQFGTTNANAPRGDSTLGWKVFTRSPWHVNDVKTFTHKQIVVPVNLQTERLVGQTKPKTKKNSS